MERRFLNLPYYKVLYSCRKHDAKEFVLEEEDKLIKGQVRVITVFCDYVGRRVYERKFDVINFLNRRGL